MKQNVGVNNQHKLVSNSIFENHGRRYESVLSHLMHSYILQKISTESLFSYFSWQPVLFTKKFMYDSGLVCSNTIEVNASAMILTS